MDPYSLSCWIQIWIGILNTGTYPDPNPLVKIGFDLKQSNI